MPVVSQELLDCAFYVYPSKRAATDGESVGGSGFFVGVPASVNGWTHLYAVTNKHVVDSGNAVLRVNTVSGGFETIETDPTKWTRSPDDDIAILPVDLGEQIDFNFVPSEIFLPETSQGMMELEVGDDAVLIGRLITHEGRQRNKPIARFGTIAMLADAREPIEFPDGHSQVAFLVDCRSLSGASGSAVLGYRVPFRDGMTMIGAPSPVLIGIDCAHLPFWTSVCEKQLRRTVIRDMWVESNSGIAVVVPAWRIRHALDHEPLQGLRKLDDQKLEQQKPAVAAATEASK